MRFVFLAMFVLASSVSAHGQERPVVRAEVSPETVDVGESVELKVIVLVPTWFTRPPVYPTFELANAITRTPADSSYPIRERVGNESWSGIVRTFEILPLLGAKYRLAGQSMSVAFANPGAEPVVVDIDLPEVVFRGQVPAGAESLAPYIAGRSLVLDLDIEGELDNLEVGDAIVLNFRAELDGLPAIFLPPLAPDLEFHGVSVYNDIPEVEDGETASRVETVTLVFDAGGEFTIPGMELEFWNSESGSVETVVAAGIDVSVQGPPAATPANDGLTETRGIKLVAAVVGLLAILLALWHGTPAIAHRYRESVAAHKATEHYSFKQLTRALGANDNEAAYHQMLRWAERLEPRMSVRDFALTYGDESLCEAIDSLSASIYSHAGYADDLRPVRAGLGAARRCYLKQSRNRSTSLLPPMNP